MKKVIHILKCIPIISSLLKQRYQTGNRKFTTRAQNKFVLEVQIW